MKTSTALLRRSRPLFGTYVEISVFLDAGDAAVMAVERAFDAMLQVQRHMACQGPPSDVSRINLAHAGETVVVHRWTSEVIELAQELCVASDGRFDCCVGGKGGSVLDIELLDDGAVRVHRPVRLDLAALVTGFAIDRAVDALSGGGIGSAMVNAGGDLRVLGPLPQALHLRWPRCPAALVYLGDLANGAAATSAGLFAPEQADPWSAWPVVDAVGGAAKAAWRGFAVLAPLSAVAKGLSVALGVEGVLESGCLGRFDARAIVV